VPAEQVVLAVEALVQALPQDRHQLMVQQIQVEAVEVQRAHPKLDPLSQQALVDLELSSLGTLVTQLHRQLQDHLLQQEQRAPFLFKRIQRLCTPSQLMNQLPGQYLEPILHSSQLLQVEF
jgi:hypothetical protein